MSIGGYDDLSVEEVQDNLQSLWEDELKKVRSYENKHRNRKTLLEQLERKIWDWVLDSWWRIGIRRIS
jgi:hypothetical protein